MIVSIARARAHGWHGGLARPKYHFLASGTERGQKVAKRRRVRGWFLTAVVKRRAEASRADLAVVSDVLEPFFLPVRRAQEYSPSH